VQIEWVNHASFVLRSRGCAVIMDPWIEGSVFDQSWSLLAPSVFTYSEFGAITHIWFSHEHPDHFSPPNLLRIPAAIRAQIHVLFQPTIDKRVIEFCRKAGFASVTELTSTWHRLGDDLSIWCEPASRGDSWAAFRSASHTLLNLNDCIYMDKDELWPLKNKIGKIDTLVTQFSYASWWGNKHDVPAWETAAAQQLEKIRREVEVLEPTFVLLSASYVFFDHEENWYMNQWVNSVHKAFAYVSQLPHTLPVVLYPGDRWLAGTEHDSAFALARYAADQDRILAQGPQHKSNQVERPTLEEAAKDFIRRLRRGNSLLLLLKIPVARIFVTDYDEYFMLSLRGLTTAKRGLADISLSSAALFYCLKNDWGGETLFINGRFEEPRGGDWGRFSRWFSVAAANRHGTFYDLGYYVKKILRLLMRRS
jgi:UDP-MurNAc hydroxylase